ncbi:MAG: serine/threonine protein kinase, partial [Myxococcota bacterium]|nr:serine/threonine protein kinase [Myxococcota bacterium]
MKETQSYFAGKTDDFLSKHLLSESRRIVSTRYDLGEKFEVMEVIGYGAMGVVLRVRHIGLDRIRAVKLLRKEAMFEDGNALERLRQEAMIASDLFHPNIVKVFDLDFAPDGSPFITMEYLEGYPLDALLLKFGLLSLERVVKLLAGAADALDCVHRAGIVHRDLKPANLFVTESGELKILDFGISHMGNPTLDLGQGEGLVGTPLYMAPEQFSQSGVDGRADIYALAAVAYEMLTARTVFDDDILHRLAWKIVHAPPPISAENLPGLPHHTVAALARGLSKKPEQRFSSAWDFILAMAGPDLGSSISRVRLSVNEEDVQRSQTTAGRRLGARDNRSSSLRHRLGLALILGVSLSAMIAIALFALREPKPTEQLRAADSIAVASAAIEFKNPNEEWLEEALSTLAAKYLALDPRMAPIVVADLPERIADTLSQEDSSLAGRFSGDKRFDRLLSLRYSKRGEKHLLVSTLTNFGELNPIWRYEAQSSGFEAAIEETTFALQTLIFKNDGAPLPEVARGEECQGDRRVCWLSSMAERAFESGLFARIDRIALDRDAAASTSLYSVAYQYSTCALSLASESCRNQIKIPDMRLVPDSEREKLVLALTRSGDAFLGADGYRCSWLKSEDPVVRVLARFLPARDGCSPDNRPICSRRDTFFDRLICIADSEMQDQSQIASRYFEDAATVDIAHHLTIAAYSSSGGDDQGEIASESRWLERSRLRHGADSASIADSMFRYNMVHRNGTEALIWARRSSRPDHREGLALALDGWLRSGIRKGVAALSLQVPSRAVLTREVV